MKKLKKNISIFLLLLLVLCTAACGEKAGGASSLNPDDGSAAGDAPSQDAADVPGADDTSVPGVPDAPNTGGASVPGTPNVPGVGGSSIMTTPGVGGNSSYTPGGSGGSGDLSSYTLEDLFNGRLDGLTFEAFSTVTEFYNSEVCDILNDFMNQICDLFNDAFGADIYQSAFISVEEPGILIYNYQYSESFDPTAVLADLKAYAESLMSLIPGDIQTFQSYGIPVTALRMNYLLADGTPVFSLDSTENPGSADLPVNPDSSALENLQAWADSEEAAETVEAINAQLASTGFTVSFAVEGNTLIYQYHLPAGLSFSDFTEEEQEATFDASVDANTDAIRSIFAMFAQEYGLNLDAVRIVCYAADGSELYRRDVTP